MVRVYSYFSVLCLLAAPAYAAEPALTPLEFSGNYGFYWNGIPFGDMRFSAATHAHTYHMQAVIRSTGLLAVFAPHESVTTLDTQGIPAQQAGRTYETRYKSKGEPRHVKLVYTAAGDVAETVVEPPENPAKRPPPTAEQTQHSLDPLTYVLAVREGVFMARQNGGEHFTLKLFEGRRLMETPYTISGQETLDDGTTHVIHCSTQRNPIAGFTAKELKNIAKGDSALHVLFSDDERMVPVKLYVDTAFGRIYAALEP